MSLPTEAADPLSQSSVSEIMSESVEGIYGCASEAPSVAPGADQRALSPKTSTPGRGGVPFGTGVEGHSCFKSPSCHEFPRRNTPKRQAPLPPSVATQAPSGVLQSPSPVPQSPSVVPHSPSVVQHPASVVPQSPSVVQLPPSVVQHPASVVPQSPSGTPQPPSPASFEANKPQEVVHNLNQLVSHPVVVLPKGRVPTTSQHNFPSRATPRNLNSLVTKHIDDDSDSDTTMSESFSEHVIFPRPQLPVPRVSSHQIPYAQQHSPRQVFHEPLRQSPQLPSHGFVSSRLIEAPITVPNDSVTSTAHLEDTHGALRQRSRRIVHSSSDPTVSVSPFARPTRQPSRQPLSPPGLDHLSEEEGSCEAEERQALIPSRYDVTESRYRSPHMPPLQRTDSTVTVAHISEDVLVSSRLKLKVTLTNLTVVTVVAALVLPNTAQVLYTAFRLAFGTLFPAYYSYKAVRTKDVKEYVKWMMYWIVLAFFSLSETVTDLLFGSWVPFYFEFKMVVVLWLLSPATKGASILYRQLIHPWLSRQEENIDAYITRAKQQGYSTLLQLGTRAVNWATTAFVTTAVKGTTTLAHHLRHSVTSEGLRSGARGRRAIAKRPEDQQAPSPLFQDLSDPYEAPRTLHDYDEPAGTGGPIIRELSESPDGSRIRDPNETSEGLVFEDVSDVLEEEEPRLRGELRRRVENPQPSSPQPQPQPSKISS
ncbi:uncharacterized protein LOC143038922 [Oratosquilla oratoria]|uniref:uncharacterized protein LOC143038922 n=1 Tax=Oratosquilla oratoria TaxID=337810 RepID=UPI003F772DD0